ncbi:hypothetical protein [Gymnodinialimonas sp.]
MLARLTLCLIPLCAPVAAQTFQPGDLVPSPHALVAPALENFEYFGEGRPSANITVAPNDNFQLEVLIEEGGFLDDSVAGSRTIYTIEYTADGWQVLSATYEQSCYRAETRDWTTEPCP